MVDGNIILSVSKAMELLQILSRADKPLLLKEVSSLCGYPKSAVFGLLTTMRMYVVVTRTPDGRYAVSVIGMLRSVQSDAFRAVIDEVCAAAAMISTALGYRKQEEKL